VNSIAEEAELLLDLRSVAQSALDDLDRRAMARVREIPVPTGVEVSVTRVGERPSGEARLTQSWVDIARVVCAEVKVVPQFVTMSSDANVPLARGVRATALGVRHGGAAHTRGEWIDPGSLVVGLEAFLLTVLAALELFEKGS
jgi:acetylornithine deacetylase/succinyl-diaminopimelate desuccinylase-like protein